MVNDMNYKAKLDRVFSQYIRLRDMMDGRVFRCISCGQIKPIEQGDCGHYINRQHMSTRYSEMNCNCQCRRCNRFDEGNVQGYRLGLVAKYGEARVAMLEAQKYQLRQIGDFEYKAMITFYQKEIKKLEEKKGKL